MRTPSRPMPSAVRYRPGDRPRQRGAPGVRAVRPGRAHLDRGVGSTGIGTARCSRSRRVQRDRRLRGCALVVCRPGAASGQSARRRSRRSRVHRGSGGRCRPSGEGSWKRPSTGLPRTRPGVRRSLPRWPGSWVGGRLRGRRSLHSPAGRVSSTHRTGAARHDCASTAAMRRARAATASHPCAVSSKSCQTSRRVGPFDAESVVEVRVSPSERQCGSGRRLA